MFLAILITLQTTKITYFVIDISTSRRKSSSALTSGSGRQYVRACPISGSIGSFPRLVWDYCALEASLLTYLLHMSGESALVDINQTYLTT